MAQAAIKMANGAGHRSARWMRFTVLMCPPGSSSRSSWTP